ncbi:MAG: hypothetical protein KAI84_06060 [Gammaproteobacteria bacterium]|nr:hypothetical protein [Gammaproteobacteria bacterium]
MNQELKILILKISQAISLLIGVIFTSYNLFSLKVVKNGYYYNDDNQLWLAFGLCFLTITYLIRNWNKL